MAYRIHNIDIIKFPLRPSKYFPCSYTSPTKETLGCLNNILDHFYRSTFSMKNYMCKKINFLSFYNVST